MKLFFSLTGMTCEGGGAIAFPVMTLAFNIDPSVARDFSLMIQSCGMTAASFTIFWMKVQLESNDEVFVRFKDYGFFVPKDAAGKKVVMNGAAFFEEMTVDDQRHYAEDEGASEDELAQITAPKKTLRFEADGVLIASQP